MYVVPGFRLVMVTVCVVVSAVLRVEFVPYAVVVPYSTCVLADWSVVQVMVAEVVVIAVAVRAVMTGAAAIVVKVALAEVARVPAELAERAA